MTAILEKLFAAADNHAEDTGEQDHAVGDLQDVLREAWSLMTTDQREQLLRGAAVEELVETGAQREFEVDDLLDMLAEDSKGRATNTGETLEIRKVLVLSTAHLSKETCLEFKQWPAIADFDEGCYFYVGQELLPELCEKIPADLKVVLEFAKQHECLEVKFDQDGEIIQELPVFEW